MTFDEILRALANQRTACINLSRAQLGLMEQRALQNAADSLGKAGRKVLEAAEWIEGAVPNLVDQIAAKSPSVPEDDNPPPAV